MYCRKAGFAGLFYPKEKDELQNSVRKHINVCTNTIKQSDIVSILSPHAGYIYSGDVAGNSFAEVKGADFDTVVILGLSHTKRFKGASVIKEGSYQTPLGDLPIDLDFSNELLNFKQFEYLEDIHEVEHSIEVQIPFIQESFDDIEIVPIIVGGGDLETYSFLADKIYKTIKKLKKKVLIIISTDLSHFHNDEEARKMDNKFIEYLKTMDPFELFQSVVSGETEACGISPVLTGIFLSKHLGAKKVKALKYDTSARTTGDKNRVVGYLSAAFVK